MHATKLSSLDKDRYEHGTFGFNDNNELDMANQIYWKPVCDNDDPLDKQLKYMLMEQDMLDDGNSMLTVKNIGFLRGIKTACLFLNAKDAADSVDKLIEAIERFGTIMLYEKEV